VRPPREGTEIKSAEGATIGKVTSGGFGPTVNGPVSMGYIERAFRRGPGAAVQLIVRDKPMGGEHRHIAVSCRIVMCASAGASEFDSEQEG